MCIKKNKTKINTMSTIQPKTCILLLFSLSTQRPTSPAAQLTHLAAYRHIASQRHWHIAIRCLYKS